MKVSLPRLPTLLRLLSLCLPFALAACSGGISGTGDGEIIVVDGNELGTSQTDINTSESTLDTQINALQIFPGSILSQPEERSFGNFTQTPTDGADSVDAQTSVAQDPTVSRQFNNQLGDYYSTKRTIIDDMTLLEANLIDLFNACESQGVCTTLPATATVSQTTTEGIVKNFSNIQLTRDTAGFFDNTFYYTRDDGAEVTLQWSNAEDLFYFYVDTDAVTTYSLTDSQTNSVTLRHVQKFTPALLQATLITTTDNSVNVEADMVDWYIRGSMNTENTVIYALNQQSLVNRRESSATDGSTVSVNTCSRDNCIWQPESNNDAVFNNTETTLGDFSRTFNIFDSDRLPLSQSELPARLVVSMADNNGAPLQSSITCGGTTLLNPPRVFCWQPTALSNDSVILYEEFYNAGITGYRQISQEP